MASELRVNSSTNRSGLGTITYTDSGPIVSGVGTFANGLTVDGTQTTVKSLKLTGDNYNANWFKTSNKLRFNDNAKATFGTADDLSIYHDGSHSIIEDTGTGNLFLRSDSVISIRGTTVAIKSADNSQTLIKGVENAGSELYYNGNLKFATTNTGATITGTAVAGALDISGDIDVDGHTNLDNVSVAGVTTFTGNANFGSNGYISGSANFTLTSNKLRVTGSDTVGIECQRSSNATIQITETTNNTDLQLRADSNGGLVRTASNTSLNLGTNQKKRIQITSDGKVQIGLPGNVESLAGGVEVVNIRAMTDGNLIVRAIGSISGAPSGSGVGIDVLNDANNAVKDLALRGSTVIFKGASDETLRISSDGNVSIGGISPVATSTAYNGATLHIHQTTSGSNYGPQIRLTSAHTGSATGDGSHISVYSTSLYINNQENGDTHFYNNGSPTATIKANGSFGIGTQAPTDKLHVNGTALVSSNFYCNNNVYLAANKGIYFDGGTSSGNYLDDYEEGSYVVSVTGSSSGSFALNPNSFRYTKIGRTVHVCGRFYVVSGSPTGSEVRVSLPFTSSADIQSQDSRAFSYVSTWNAYTPNNDYSMSFAVLPNSGYGVLLWIVPGGQWQTVSPSSHMNQRNAYYGFDFTYTTAT